MTILGIETSCDETAAAIVEKKDGKLLLRSNIISSSLDLHAETGGIIPEIAARKQIEFIHPVLQKALEESFGKGKTSELFSQIDAIAVTYGPGLIGSLLVGVETAKTLSLALNKPLIPVNHMVGHIYANFIDTAEESIRKEQIQFPALALVVSGGHTDLLLMKAHGEFQLLGGTRDDAAGECFDKCARLLGYNYPGGPKIAQLATKGDPKHIPFPRPMLGSHDYDFSFSGLKTAFLNETKKHFPILRNNISPNEKIGWQQAVVENNLTPKEKQTIYDLCASLEDAIFTVLIKKLSKAAKEYTVQSILLSGGVAADKKLRERLGAMVEQLPDTNLFFPTKKLCTDNAAMIAAAAAYAGKPVPWENITADPELYFDEN